MTWQWLWIPATVIFLSEDRRKELFKEIRDDLCLLKADISEALKKIEE
jgi:hypothetical protein